MTAVERLAGDVVCPVAPDVQGVIPGRQRAFCAPQDLGGAGDLPSRGPILLVEQPIVGRAGAVVLADGVDDRCVPGAANVVGNGLRLKTSYHTTELGVEEEPLRIGRDQRLGDGIRLGQQRPVPVAQREALIGTAPHLTGGNDVQDAEPTHDLGVIQGSR